MRNTFARTEGVGVHWLLWLLTTATFVFFGAWFVAQVNRLMRQERYITIAREAGLLYVGRVKPAPDTVIGIDCGIPEAHLRWWHDWPKWPDFEDYRGGRLYRVGPGGRVDISAGEVWKLYQQGALEWYAQHQRRGQQPPLGYGRFQALITANKELLPEVSDMWGVRVLSPSTAVYLTMCVLGGALVAAWLALLGMAVR